MGRKIFMTFLGTSKYEKCNYIFLGEKVNNVVYVQEAICRILCKDWNENDRIIVFLTDEARKSNWISSSNNNGMGLKPTLENLYLKAKIEDVSIPTVESMDDLKELFDIVFDKFLSDDEVFIDITHSFRMIPFIVSSIVNFATVVKNITVSGIFYGAIEALGPLQQIPNMDIEDRNVFVINLNYFNTLNNWALGADEFVRLGNAQKICEMAYNHVKPLLAESKGQDEAAKQIKQIGDMLNLFTQNILTSRCKEIMYEFDYTRLKSLIEELGEPLIRPFGPLIDYVCKEIRPYKDKSIFNGFLAVEWCIKHNLIQQGYTILLETLISYIIFKVFKDNEIIWDKDIRELVNMAINIKCNKISYEDWLEKARKNKEKILLIMESLDDNLIRKINVLMTKRNDINHCGCREDCTTPERLKNTLKKIYDEILKLVSSQQ